MAFTKANAYFHLARMDAEDGKYAAALDGFKESLKTASNQDIFPFNFDGYFNKKYKPGEDSLFNAFTNKIFASKLEYLSYTSIMYLLARDTRINRNQDVEDIFLRMHRFTDFDAYTWYHKACYYALNKNKKAALESIKKSLKLGFGIYYVLIKDYDLDFIQDTREYKQLLKKYFPHIKH